MNLTVWAWVGLVILSVAPFGTYALGIHHGHAEGKHRRTCSDRETELEARHDEWMAKIRGPWDGWDDPRFLKPPYGGSDKGTGVAAPVPARLDHITAADLRDAVVVPEPPITADEILAMDARAEAYRRAMVSGEQAHRAKTGWL